MSNSDFIKSVLEILQLNDSFHRFIPVPFRNSDSFIKKVDDVMYINLVSQLGLTACPHCGSVARHTSKGIRSINLTHFSFGFFKVVLVVNYHRFICNDCHHYFKEDIPFQFDNRKITVTNAQSALVEFSENHSMASIIKVKII